MGGNELLNTININLKTDIKTDRPTTLPIKLMSQDKNNNQFILRFTNGVEKVALDDTYTVDVLTKFTKSGASRLTTAKVRQDYATWGFDTAYITQDEKVVNYVYVRKAGSLVVSADANAFVFDVGLSEIDKDAGRVAEMYDENYQKYLDEFKGNVDLEKIAQAEQDRTQAETERELSEGERKANEEARELSESERENAEAQREIDHANRSAELAGKADKVVINNLVDAGDGTKGLSGWDSNNSSNVLEDDYLTNIGDGTLRYPQVWRNIIFNAGEKYYVSFRYKTTSSQIVVSAGTFGAGRVGESTVESSETWYTYSSYFEPHNRATVMRMYHTYSDADSANGGKLSMNDVIVVNLTETFGAGNEPTKEEMDELIKFTVCIDGGYALNNKEMLRYLTNSTGELKPNEFAPKYVYSPNVISNIDGEAPHPTSSQIYSNNVRMVENAILTDIKVQIKTSEIGDYYFDLYVIEPNVRIVSKTRVDYSATIVGNETVTISGLDINVPKGSVVATQTPQGAKSVIRYYSDSSLGSIQTYTSVGNEISKISGKVAHELYVNVKIELAEITTELENNVLEMDKRLSVAETEMENLTEKDHILKGKTWSVVGDSISDNINYGRLTLYYEWISEMVGGVQIDMQGKAATGFIQESGSQGTKNIMDRIPLLNPLSDYITVFAGTNDVDRPLGTLGSTDVTTLYGAIDFVCKALIEKYPLKKIGFFTPIPRVNYTAPDNKLEQVARAIKEVCALYSIPVLDLYTESGLRPNNVINKQTFFDNNDGLHPNSEGHKWLVPRILDFMEKL